MYYDLTQRELGTLRMLVIKEAKSLGYGDHLRDKYNPENKREWPSRLKKLLTIANKLQAQKDYCDRLEAIQVRRDYRP